MEPQQIPARLKPGQVIRETRVVEGVTWARLEDAEAPALQGESERWLSDSPRWIVIAYEPIPNDRFSRESMS